MGGREEGEKGTEGGREGGRERGREGGRGKGDGGREGGREGKGEGGRWEVGCGMLSYIANTVICCPIAYYFFSYIHKQGIGIILT